MVNSKFNVKYCVFLPIVLVITIFLWAVPTSFFGIDALTPVQQRVIALFVFAALMWMFEIVPNWTTSLLVIVLSLLTVSDKGLSFLCKPEYGTLVNYKSLMSAFADPVIMLFLGGFVLAIMASKYGLDVTLARVLLKPFGKKPKMVLLGFLIVIAVFSMFMSNTATAAMMLALLAPVLASLPKDDKGRVGLALSIPVSANLGGIGTTIGTPPNATAVRFLTEAGHEVAFDTWAIHMIPFVIIMVLIAWVLLQMFFPFKSEEIVLNIPENKRKKDWKTTVVWITFAGTILLWATEQLTGRAADRYQFKYRRAYPAGSPDLHGHLHQGRHQGDQLDRPLARCRRLRPGYRPSGDGTGRGPHRGYSFRLHVSGRRAYHSGRRLLLPVQLHLQLRYCFVADPDIDRRR